MKREFTNNCRVPFATKKSLQRHTYCLGENANFSKKNIVLLLSRTILASFAEDEVKNKVSQAVKLSMNNSLVATYLHLTIGGGGKSANLPPFFANSNTLSQYLLVFECFDFTTTRSL